MPTKKKTAAKKKKPAIKQIKIRPINSEVRIDEIHDRFIIIAPKRTKRPHDVAKHQDVPIK